MKNKDDLIGIVIDAGHGGSDSGATGNGIIEKNLTLDISKYMYDRFKQLGIPVKITRNTDETLSPTERVNKIIDSYGRNKNVILISNHINAGGGDGAEVIYALRNNDVLSNLILNELQKEGQNVRRVYQRRLPSDPTKDYYFIHRNTSPIESILVEYGFLDSTGDDVKQLKNNYKDYAEAVVRAVLQYLNIDYNEENSGENTYIVKSGDTIWKIARQYGITVDNLKQANNLTSNILTIGQKLIIPVEQISSPNYITYTVKKGDTLYSISLNNNTTVDELKKINNLTSNTLSIGEQILIPSSNTIIDIPLDGYIDYIVQRGDTLYSLSRQFNTSINDIMKLNNLMSNLLTVGQTIKIPVQGSNIEQNIYEVQRGDTLYSIAKKFNTTINRIKARNNLTSNLLTIGQQLVV